MSTKNDKSFKIIVLGEAGVGKSSLLRRYTQGTFSSRTTTTVGVDRIPLNVCVEHEELQFQVLDTAGSVGFRELIKSYMTNIEAVVFMYDISNKESFASLPLWTTLLKSAGKQNLTKVLVGNKKDLALERRQVKFKNAKNYAEFEGMISMEISVKEEDSIDVVFQCIARELKLKRQLAASSLAEKSNRTPYLYRRIFQSAGTLPQTTNDKEFIENANDSDGAGSDSNSPKQFVRKLSLMITGKNKFVRKQTHQQQQQQRKESAPNSSLYTTRFRDDNTVRASERRYLLW